MPFLSKLFSEFVCQLCVTGRMHINLSLSSWLPIIVCIKRELYTYNIYTYTYNPNLFFFKFIFMGSWENVLYVGNSNFRQLGPYLTT